MKRQAKSYSIVDHELLHGGYLSRLTHKALVLYLFLTVVGDSMGRNYYSISSVGKILRMDPFEVVSSRDELIKEGLIRYRNPYWCVLTLTYPREADKTRNCVAPLVDRVLKKSEVMKND